MNEPISGTICRILKTVFAFDSLIIEEGYKVFKFMLQPFEVEHKKKNAKREICDAGERCQATWWLLLIRVT